MKANMEKRDIQGMTEELWEQVEAYLKEETEEGNRKAEEILTPYMDTEDPKAHRILGDIAYRRKARLRAIRYYLYAAERGDAMAQAALGVIYAQGENMLRPDYKKAKEFLEAALEQGGLGDVPIRDEAYYWLGHIYLSESGEMTEQGRDFMADLAGRGDARAMFELGVLYAEKKEYWDFDQAVYWLQKAGGKGYLPEEAENRLIRLAMDSAGKDGKDREKGLELLESCENSEDPGIRYQLGLLETEAGNEKAALDHFLFAAAKGSAEAQSAISTKSLNEIVRRCLASEAMKEAVRWLESVLVQANLSLDKVLEAVYRSTEKKKVLRFFEAAADSDNQEVKSSALYYLGRAYFEEGEFKDPEKGKDYLERAAELDHGGAMCLLGEYYHRRYSDEKDFQNLEKALELFSRAVERNVPGAAAGLWDVERKIEHEEPIRDRIGKKLAEYGLTEKELRGSDTPLVLGKQHFDRLIFRSGERRRRVGRNGTEEYNGLRYFTEVRVADIKECKRKGYFYATAVYSDIDGSEQLSYRGIALVDDYAYTRDGKLIDMSVPHMTNAIIGYDAEGVINCTPFWGPDPLRRIPEEIQEMMKEADPDADGRDQEEVRQFLALIERKGCDAPEAFLRLKEKGDTTVCVMLAESYETGTYGLEKNEEKAAELYRKAAGKGDCDACARLGDLYRTGRGVAENWRAALNWYEKAIGKHSYNESRRGVAIAWVGEGLLFCGEGKASDTALELWRKATESEFPVESAIAKELLKRYVPEE